jgi:hypothetical protein
MKRFLVLHPMFLAVFPVAALYSVNVTLVSPSEIVVPTAIAIGFALILLTISGLIGEWSGAHNLLMAIWGIIFVLGTFWVIRTHRDLQNLTKILNIGTAVLVAIPLFNIVFHETRAAVRNVETVEHIASDTLAVGDAETLPDIYYIILDRYPREDTLEDVFNYDNSEFLEYLTDKGFYIASKSTSNYLKTRSSLASSLNMKYIDYLTEDLGEDYTDLEPIFALLHDYEVWHLLKSQGYEFIHFGSWWWQTYRNDNADENFTFKSQIPGLGILREMPEFYDIPEFSMLLLRTTLLYHAYVKLNFMEDDRMMQWRRVLYKFEKLAEIPERTGPTYVFAHILVPHHPYVFDSDGSYITKEVNEGRSREVNFTNQVTFVNGKLMELIDKLVSESEIPPIIILQADEGPFPEGTDKDKYGWEEASEEQLKEKMRILNAYHFPGVDTGVLYPSITPVNSFRVLFNLYFDADFELLPDRNYVFYKEQPYNFLEVTDILQSD